MLSNQPEPADKTSGSDNLLLSLSTATKTSGSEGDEYRSHGVHWDGRMERERERLKLCGVARSEVIDAEIKNEKKKL